MPSLHTECAEGVHGTDLDAKTGNQAAEEVNKLTAEIMEVPNGVIRKE